MQISEYLVEHKIPAAQFARRIGVIKQTFFKYVHGLAFPPPLVLKKIHDETGGAVTATDFVDQHLSAAPEKDSAAAEVAV